jgi:hypothetical protein
MPPKAKPNQKKRAGESVAATSSETTAADATATRLMPRSAKTAALRNAGKYLASLYGIQRLPYQVWLNGQSGGQGTTARKRGRQPSTPVKSSNKRIRKECKFDSVYLCLGFSHLLKFSLAPTCKLSRMPLPTTLTPGLIPSLSVLSHLPSALSSTQDR